MNKEKRRTGFTLAEVLIALGIIGVVAAMTIPSLVQKYQERAWDTSAKVFERKLDESLKIMNTQGVIGQRVTTENFVNELAKYIKISKICDNSHINDCFANDIHDSQIFNLDTNSYESSDNEVLKHPNDYAKLGNYGTNALGVQFVNGVSAIVSYNPACRGDQFNSQFNGFDCISMLYDVTGGAKPNTTGKDIRPINVFVGSGIKFNNTNWTLPFRLNVSTNNPQKCIDLANNGAGNRINMCSEGKDYWINYLEKCGNMSNMPTMSDLKKLALLLYDADNKDVGKGDDYLPNKSMNIQKAQTFLSGSQYSDKFYLWSNEQYGNGSAEGMAYFPTFVRSNDGVLFTGGKGANNYLGICKMK